MPSVLDVAQTILELHGEMTTMKLQKLVYYSQAWNIAWNDNTLFPEKIEAWADGPVTPELYKRHAGQFRIRSIPGGSSSKLSEHEKETIKKVIAFYGDKSPQWLSDLTHEEDPWRNARQGTPDGARSDAEISPQAMGAYYSAL